MVGKAKRPRLHRATPRPRPWPARDAPPLPQPVPGPGPGPGPGAGGWMAAAGKDWDFPSSNVFSGLEIDPATLVRKLDLDSRSIISSRTGWQYPSLQTGEVEQPSGCWQMLFLAQQLGSVPPPGEVQIVLCALCLGSTGKLAFLHVFVATPQ